jgi:hypothetical protein
MPTTHRTTHRTTHPKTHITITDHETKHLTQHETHTLTRTHLLLKNFDLTKPIKYDYNPHTQTTTIHQ